MKFRIFYLFVLLASCHNRKIEVGHQTCSYYGELLSAKVELYTSEREASSIINEIIKVIGLKPRFNIKASNIPNAAAVIYKNERYVLYNPDFVDQLNLATGTKWASVSILAHEIGHHLNGHTLENNGSRPDIELEADEFSGFILRKLGASLGEAQAAMKVASNVKASHTHPAKIQRLAAIERGWKTAGSATDNPVRKQEIKKPVIVQSPQLNKTVLQEQYIACTVIFDADEKSSYFVTIRGNLVKADNKAIYIIGRMADSNLAEYKYMFYDKHYNYLYINADGKILNGNKLQVGIIKCK